jgi:lysophospholipase L1-like esterase
VTILKIIKVFLALLLIVALSVAAWIYYPKYQLSKLKEKHSHIAQQNDNVKLQAVTYLDDLKKVNKESIFLLALGDSIVAGVGDSTKRGFVDLMADDLSKSTNKPVNVQNKGVPGRTSGELLFSLQYDNGLREEIKKADMITINIGGNDIIRSVDRKNIKNSLKNFNYLKKNFSFNLNKTIQMIRSENPDASIVLLELYSPVEPEDKFYSMSNQLLPQWNVVLYKLMDQYDSLMVVETSNVIDGQNGELVSKDGFHPSPEGYEAINEQIMTQMDNEVKEVVRVKGKVSEK